MMRATQHLYSALAVAVASAACPTVAQDVKDILFASDGPLVTGLSYCYAVSSGKEDKDAAAAGRKLLVQKNEFGEVDPVDRAEDDWRAFRRTYTGPSAGTDAYPPGNDDLYVVVRLRGAKCESVTVGVPMAYENNVIQVTQDILAQLDPGLRPFQEQPFSKILVAGTGPAWHGDLGFTDMKYMGSLSFGANRAGMGVWDVTIRRTD